MEGVNSSIIRYYEQHKTFKGFGGGDFSGQMHGEILKISAPSIKSIVFITNMLCLPLISVSGG